MKKILLFDFDGVIVNTFDMAFGLSQEMGQGLSKDEYRKCFEGNIYEKTQDAIGEEIDMIYDEVWFAKYTSKMLEIAPVSGMLDAIIELEKEYTLIVISSSITSPIKQYLEKHNIGSHFDKVFGADVHRSKTEKIKMVFDQYNAKPEDCIFITDTLGDMREAREAGVDSIGVTWGFHEKERLEKGNPVKIVDTVDHLVEVIRSVIDMS